MYMFDEVLIECLYMIGTRHRSCLSRIGEEMVSRGARRGYLQRKVLQAEGSGRHLSIFGGRFRSSFHDEIFQILLFFPNKD